MRRYAMTRAAAAFLATAALPGIAAAANAVVTTDLNMRAGPATEFPVVEVIPDDGQVTVHGCVSGYQWCDVTWRDARGWVFADYLRYQYQTRYVPLVDYATIVDVPVITFTIDSYWDNYYRSRPWYDQRARWRDVWRDDRRDNRAERREDRREERADRRQDRREDGAERRERRRDARSDGQRDERVERRQERRETRVDRREQRRDTRAESRRENRAERGQERREIRSERRDLRAYRGGDNNRAERRPERREMRMERREQPRDAGAGSGRDRGERGGRRGREG